MTTSITEKKPSRLLIKFDVAPVIAGKNILYAFNASVIPFYEYSYSIYIVNTLNYREFEVCVCVCLQTVPKPLLGLISYL